MRVIAGAFKGRRLTTPTWDGLRPTSDRLRETLFDILGERVVDAEFIDVFAGTGAVGIEMRVNGQPRRALVPPHHSLLEVLRGSFHLTGVKEGCGNGECGSCSVLVEGRVVNACLYLAVRGDGKEVLTIEGLGTPEDLHPLQTAFLEHGAVQCGYCTPGMLLTAKALLDENPNPTEEDIRAALLGNLCRCGVYTHVTQAILSAAGK